MTELDQVLYYFNNIMHAAAVSYTIDPVNARTGGACISSERIRVRATRDHTIPIGMI